MLIFIVTANWLKSLNGTLFSHIQSASEDSGCGLFLYRIYEEYHINLSLSVYIYIYSSNSGFPCDTHTQIHICICTHIYIYTHASVQSLYVYTAILHVSKVHRPSATRLAQKLPFFVFTSADTTHMLIFIFILTHLHTHFFFIIQRVKARAILCPHQPPTRVITQFR